MKDAWRPYSVLVVDDEPDIRKMLSLMLRTAGFEVTVAENAQQALALVLELNFDAVVTDIRMPRDSGVDLLFWIKEHRPSLPVFLITGNIERAEFPEVREMSAGLFPKPFSPRALVEAVKLVSGWKPQAP
jgi:DNA-binding response OmpR family regulator